MPLVNPVRAAGSTVKPLHSDDIQALLRKIGSYLATGLGLYGVKAITGAATVTGNFWVFHALTDTTVSSVTYADGSSFTAGTLVKAGDRIYGQITSITISAGTGELYVAGGA